MGGSLFLLGEEDDTPTYLVQSILTYVLYEHENISKNIPDYKESLSLGYDFSTRKGYEGHGFNSVGDMIRTLNMFDKTYVLQKISENPDFSSKSYDNINNIKSYVRKRLKEGETKGGWDYDFKEDFEDTLNMLEEYDF